MARGRTFSYGRLMAQVLTLGLVAAAAALAPRLADGYGALQWTRFHARQATGSHAADHARRAGHAAARVVDLTAPLPWASEAAGLALRAGQALGPKNGPSAAAVYAEVAGVIDRAASSPVRGLGLEAVAALAHTLDAEARRPPEATP